MPVAKISAANGFTAECSACYMNGRRNGLLTVKGLYTVKSSIGAYLTVQNDNY